MQIVIDPTSRSTIIVDELERAFVEMHVCATFPVDDDTGLLVTGFQEALECLYF